MAKPCLVIKLHTPDKNPHQTMRGWLASAELEDGYLSVAGNTALSAVRKLLDMALPDGPLAPVLAKVAKRKKKPS